METTQTHRQPTPQEIKNEERIAKVRLMSAEAEVQFGLAQLYRQQAWELQMKNIQTEKKLKDEGLLPADDGETSDDEG